MGTLTLADFRTELLFDLKNRTDTTAVEGVNPTRLDMWINAGLLHVTHPTVFRHREFQYSYTITLVAGQHPYTFTPNGTVAITALRSVTHVAAAADDPTARQVKLSPRDEQWFRARTLNNGGPPREYYVRGSSLFISPIPTAVEAGQVLVVGAWREPAVLTADADRTTISTLWDEIVLLAARWRAELHLGYRDLAEATKLDFASLINEYQDFQQLHGEDWDWVAEVRTESSMERA